MFAAQVIDVGRMGWDAIMDGNKKKKGPDEKAAAAYTTHGTPNKKSREENKIDKMDECRKKKKTPLLPCQGEKQKARGIMCVRVCPKKKKVLQIR